MQHWAVRTVCPLSGRIQQTDFCIFGTGVRCAPTCSSAQSQRLAKGVLHSTCVTPTRSPSQRSMRTTTLVLAVFFSLLVMNAARADWTTTGPYCALAPCVWIDSAAVFAGATQTGLYRSLDNGDHWTLLDSLRGLSPYDIVRFKGAVVVGNLYGSGYVSTDNGNIWTVLTTAQISRLKILHDTLYACSYSGVQRFVTPQPNNDMFLHRTASAIAQTDHGFFAITSSGFLDSLHGDKGWKVVSTAAFSDAMTDLAGIGPVIVAATNGGGVYVSSDDGATWVARNTGLPGLHVNRLEYIDGSLYACTSTGLFASTDLGLTWHPVGSAPWNAYTYSVARSKETWVASTRSGVYRSLDGGSTWQFATAGMSSTRVSAVDAYANSIVAGTIAGTFRSQDNGATWAPTVTTGIDAPIKRFARSSRGLFGITDYDVQVSSDDGRTWNAGGFSSSRFPSAIGVSASGTVLVGTGNYGIYRSTDNGATFAIASVWPADRGFHAFAASGETVFAGTQYGIYRSTDDGIHWTEPDTSVSRITVVDMCAAGTAVYAASANKVIRTTDNGETWHAVGAGRTWQITSIAGVGRNVFVGTGNTVQLTTDDGASWHQVDTGLAASVSGISATNDRLFVVTLGDGVWQRPLREMIDAVGENPAPAIPSGLALRISPNPARANIDVTCEFAEPSSHAVLAIVTIAGDVVKLLRADPASPPMHVSVADLPPGSYVFRVSDGQRSASAIVEVVH